MPVSFYIPLALSRFASISVRHAVHARLRSTPLLRHGRNNAPYKQKAPQEVAPSCGAICLNRLTAFKPYSRKEAPLSTRVLIYHRIGHLVKPQNYILSTALYKRRRRIRNTRVLRGLGLRGGEQPRAQLKLLPPRPQARNTPRGARNATPRASSEGRGESPPRGGAEGTRRRGGAPPPARNGNEARAA